MAWRDDYRPGSWRGVPFHLKSATRTGGRRTVLDEFPLRDTPSTQDMGRKARQFNLVMTVIGTDYMAQRDELIEALEASGPGTLMHPFYGELYVAPLGDYSIEESLDQGGLARITQNFVEAGEKPRPDSQPLAGAAVNSAADLVQAEALEEFEDKWGVLGFASSVAEHAEAALGTATGFLGDAFETAQGWAGMAMDQVGGLYSTAQGYANLAMNKLNGITSGILSGGGLLAQGGQFGTLLGRFTGSISSLILSPGNLGMGLLGLVRGMTSSLSPFGAFQALTSLFGLGSKAKSVRGSGYVTPARAQQATNQAAIYTLIERAAVAEAARLATGRPLAASAPVNGSTVSSSPASESTQVLPGLTYNNREEAVETRDVLVAELDRQQLQASPERYRALAGLTTALVADLNRRSASLAPLTRFTPGATMPALVIAHRLYGDASRAGEIVARNRIAHPGFVPGGQALEVLKDA